MTKYSNNIEDLKHTSKQFKNINWNQLIETYRTLQKSTAEFTFYWRTHSTFTR